MPNFPPKLLIFYIKFIIFFFKIFFFLQIFKIIRQKFKNKIFSESICWIQIAEFGAFGILKSELMIIQDPFEFGCDSWYGSQIDMSVFLNFNIQYIYSAPPLSGYIKIRIFNCLLILWFYSFMLLFICQCTILVL